MIRKALFGFVWFLGAWREALRSVPARLTVATREPCDATDGAQPQPDATADAPLEPARRAGRRRSLPALARALPGTRLDVAALARDPVQPQPEPLPLRARPQRPTPAPAARAATEAAVTRGRSVAVGAANDSTRDGRLRPDPSLARTVVVDVATRCATPEPSHRADEAPAIPRRSRVRTRVYGGVG